MNEVDLPEVEIRADEATQSLGSYAYIAAASGEFESRGKKASIFVTFIIIAAIATLMHFTKKTTVATNDSETNAHGLSTPSMSLQDQGINPKLLTEKDLTNLIPHPKVLTSIYGKIRILSLRSVSELPIGSEMHAVLASGATDGIVKAVLTLPLMVDGEPILPERAVLFGRGKSGETRLFVEFSKVILPTGETYPIRAQAFDLNDQILGLKGAIVGTRTKKMAGAIGFGLIGGMAAGLQDTSGSFFNQRKPTLRDGALAGASKASLDQSQAFMDEMKKSPNTIEVQAGTNIVVMTDEPKKKSETLEE